ncbi:hypothetical protein [Frigoriglobus tundricola]|uniref:hypothetical protein n=1 Tax=Frigoriglobus tundricola TaxID=2774151 RepID=UPI00148EC663|nr:hypothetical protein [Frigoriglobus tundricola]
MILFLFNCSSSPLVTASGLGETFSCLPDLGVSVTTALDRMEHLSLLPPFEERSSGQRMRMRRTGIALLAAAMAASKCSAFVAGRGEDLNAFDTREQVRRAFGTPVASSGEGGAADEYRTHRKISEKWRGEYLVIGCVATLGLAEVVTLPMELFNAARQRIVGHHLRFSYDADGKVIAVTVDGETPPWLGHQPGRSPTP